MKSIPKMTTVLGTRVRQLRKEKGWTQAELAEKIDKTTEMICHLENGSASTKLKTLENIAKAFDVEVSSLLKERPELDLSKLSADRLQLFEELEKANDEVIKLITQLIHKMNSKR